MTLSLLGLIAAYLLIGVAVYVLVPRGWVENSYGELEGVGVVGYCVGCRYCSCSGR